MMPTEKRLAPIAEKVLAGQRLNFEDGLALYASQDLPALGALANHVRERLHGDRTYYNINLHINPTNACFASCRFCAFGRKAFDEKAYILTPEEIVARARRSLPEGASEIHLVGGIDPRLKIEFYCGYIRALKQAFPHVHIKTLTPVEVVFIAKMSKLTVRETIERLREAGMDSMPGGGAEIFDDEVREQICEHKCDAAQWFETHREMHRLGMRTNCTMLIGHVEQPRHRVDHLMRLRAHQDEWAVRDETGNLLAGFQCFIPLSFHPKNTAMSHLPGPTGHDELRNFAVCRLMLDNIPHIKAYWIMLGVKQAQVAQWFGANDIDGTVVNEEIYHDAGASTPTGMTVEEIRRLVRECGRTPVQRDSLYREIAPVS
ncbi:MAG: aminofutalosine synthase MqnE [Candidatus Sumerlaeia bacterium]|nr:aminofutalosine synthase MqnE [Candidatus Sumerlaeia bacterium]